MTTLTMSANRPQQIVDRIKRLTCRPVMPGDVFRPANEALKLPAAVISGKGILKWKVGGTVGIKPQRIAPVCLVDKNGKVVTDLRTEWQRWYALADWRATRSAKQMRDDLLEVGRPGIDGYTLLRTTVLSLKRYDVRDMTLAEARDEGFAGPGGDSVIGFWRFWCGTYDAEVLANGTVKEHHQAYEAGRCSWEQYYCLLESMVWQRPSDQYTAWQIGLDYTP